MKTYDDDERLETIDDDDDFYGGGANFDGFKDDSSDDLGNDMEVSILNISPLTLQINLHI